MSPDNRDTSSENAEVARLRSEVERLQGENANLKAEGVGRPMRSTRMRNGWALVLAVLAALFFALAVPAIWLDRVVFDTDTWVETVGPLAEDPAIQDAVSTAASDAIIEQLDAEQRLRELLPAQLDQIAPLLASTAENTIVTQTRSLVRSDRFAQIWTEINRTGHSALVAAVRGQEGTLTIEAGTFTLQTGPIVDEVKSRLSARGLGFVDRIPTGSLDREVTLFHSDALASAGPVFAAVGSAATALPLVAVALAAGAFALARDRRRVALWLGVGIVIAALLPLQAVYLGQYPAVAAVEDLDAIPSAAAQSAYTIIFRDLITAEQVLAVVGLLVWAIAIVAGPAHWAVALRTGLKGGLAGAASHLQLGGFGVWVARHRNGLRTVGFIVAATVLLLLPAPRSIAQIVWLAVGLVVWVLAVEFLGSSSQATAPSGPGVERGAGPARGPSTDEERSPGA